MTRIRLAEKRLRWGLTIWGWLTLFLFMVMAGFIFLKTIVPFLSVEKTIDSDVMIVEGYVAEYSYEHIISTFNKKNYRLLITSGTSYEQGFIISGFKTSADLIGQTLIFMGFDSTKLAIVPLSPEIQRDRTYNAALVVKKYLLEKHPEVKKVNVISQSVHARRSLRLFRQAMGDEIEVGNIVIPSDFFDKDDWYKTSRGFRTVTNEAIAYFYVLFFFHP